MFLNAGYKCLPSLLEKFKLDKWHMGSMVSAQTENMFQMKFDP